MLWKRSPLRMRSIKSATLFARLVESSFLVVNNRILVLRAKNRAWHLCGLEAVGQPNPVAFRLPCQNPLADMDPSSQIWTPLPNFPVKHRLNHIWLLVLFASFLSLVSYRFMTFLDNCKISLTNFTIIQTGSSVDLPTPGLVPKSPWRNSSTASAEEFCYSFNYSEGLENKLTVTPLLGLA